MNVLLVIDVQNDFCPGGSLAVSGGDDIIPTINKLIESGKFEHVIATQDWHPVNHISFARQNEKPFEFSDRANQVILPIHCVQGTKGAELKSTLSQNNINMIIRKGTNSYVDSYSAFFENMKSVLYVNLDNYIRLSTGLENMLNGYHSGLNVYVCGIATDFCVKATAKDAKMYIKDVNVSVITDACAGLTPDGEIKALMEMENMGINLIPSKDLL